MNKLSERMLMRSAFIVHEEMQEGSRQDALLVDELVQLAEGVLDAGLRHDRECCWFYGHEGECDCGIKELKDDLGLTLAKFRDPIPRLPQGYRPFQSFEEAKHLIGRLVTDRNGHNFGIMYAGK